MKVNEMKGTTQRGNVEEKDDSKAGDGRTGGLAYRTEQNAD